MDYKRMGDNIYIRFDRGEEIITGVMEVCKKEEIISATYIGIGGCSEVIKLTYRPSKDAYLEHIVKGNLDMASLTGNITVDENGTMCHHTHTVFSYTKENDKTEILAGHTLRTVVSYAAEIVVMPAQGVIRRTTEQGTGAQIWHLY